MVCNFGKDYSIAASSVYKAVGNCASSPIKLGPVGPVVVYVLDKWQISDSFRYRVRVAHATRIMVMHKRFRNI